MLLSNAHTLVTASLDRKTDVSRHSDEDVGAIHDEAPLSQLSSRSVRSFGCDFLNRRPGGGFVNDALAGGEGRHQRLEGEVVDRAGDPPGGVVDGRQGVVGEQGVRAPGEREVVLDVGGGLDEIHPVDVVAQGDPPSAAKAPSLILRRSVGWPSSTSASGEAESISKLVRILSCSSWSGSSK